MYTDCVLCFISSDDSFITKYNSHRSGKKNMETFLSEVSEPTVATGHGRIYLLFVVIVNDFFSVFITVQARLF